jgi:predicted ArsR family transcriptional regulator
MTHADSSADPITAVAALGEPTRRRLFEWVVAQPDAVGRDQAATALGIGRPLAAFHLDRLVEAGLLAVEYRRLTGRSGPGAGRPAKLYRASEADVQVSLPARRYDVVAQLLAEGLDDAADPRSREAVRSAARRRGQAMGERARKELGRRPGQARARSAVVATLERAGYAPRTQPDGTIRLANCPYDALVDEHRDLICGANVAMTGAIAASLGAGLEARLAPARGWCCAILEPAAAAAAEDRPAT